MKRHIGIIVLAFLVVIVLLLGTVAYVVDETKDVVLITRFGAIDRTIWGKEDPGLHFKWPWPIERVVRFDSRNNTLTSPYRQFTIGQSLNVMATAYCTWRIEDAETFYRAKRDRTAGVEKALESLLSSEMTNVLGEYHMAQLVNTDPKKMELGTIAEKIRQRVQAQASRDYGVTLTDLGIEQLGLPKQVSGAVINAMKAEREKEANRYRAEGKATAEAIIGRANAAKQTILAFADRKAGDIRTQGEAEAAKAYTHFEKDPEFAMFLRSLETLRASLNKNAVFVLDADTMPILEWLRTKPTLSTFGTKKN